DFDRAAPDISGRGQPARELIPRFAAVRAAIEAALGTAAVVSEHRAAARVRGRVENVRALAVDRDIADPRVLVDEERLGPRGPAVRGHKDPAIGIRPPESAQRGHIYDVRVHRMDDDSPDVHRVLQTDMLPGLARVHRLVDAVAPGRALSVVGLARAHIDDGGI